jgi:membrane-bound inhibitor of C-type lysozyme
MIPIKVHRLFFVFIVVTLISSAYAWAGTADSVDPTNKITAIYLSDKDKTLTVTFDIANDSVEVKLPDGRQVKLPRGISASGARYTDGKETLWEHHGEGAYWVW